MKGGDIMMGPIRKARKVMTYLELKTDANLKELRDPKLWEFKGNYNYLICHQATAQVIKEEK